MKPKRPEDRIIVALDVPTMDAARPLIGQLSGRVGAFKVGKQLYVAAGPRGVWEIRARGGKTFLDLKFHDIPQTVAGASQATAKLGVFMFNVHCSGGPKMMRAAREAVDVTAQRGPHPLILGVTILTSLDYTELVATFPFLSPDLPAEEQDEFMQRLVVHLARLAQDCGLDGVVASSREVAAIRQACGRDFIIVSPGIRPAGSAKDDQQRIGTPGVAVRAGADYLVVGRPITEAADPVVAAKAIAAEIAAAQGGTS